jgi:hypothetical protein
MNIPAPLVTLIDDALPRARFARLLHAIEALGSERLRSTYQTTFWYPLDAKPSNLVEEAVQRLQGLLTPERRRRAIGVEWWLSRMRTSNVGVDFHHDRDNVYFERTGRERVPWTSSVFYLNRSRGGLLAVTKRRPVAKNPALAPPLDDCDVVEPAPNRFTFFPGVYTHGVLDANNDIPGAKLPREPALRLAIAINFWHLRPEGVGTWPESRHYRSLGLTPRR